MYSEGIGVAKSPANAEYFMKRAKELEEQHTNQQN
jgi:hypothetical protein